MRKLFKAVAFSLIVSVSLILILELGQRARYAVKNKDAMWLKYGFHKKKGRFPNGKHTYNNITCTINSRQFRGGEIDVPKPAGTFRIVALGDSITFGIDNPDEYTYPRLLDELLKQKRTPEGKVEVINAGTPGYSSASCLAFLKNDVLAVKPDLLAVMVGWNDVINGIYEGTTSVNSISNNILWYLTKKSILVMTLREKLAAKSGNIDKMYWKNVHSRPPDTVFARYESNLNKILAEAKANNIRAFLIKFPYQNKKAGGNPQEFQRMVQKYMAVELREDYKRIHGIIDKVGGQNKVAVFDAASYFTKMPDQDSLFSPDGIHLSNEGNKVFSRIVYSFIEANDLTE
ncbi:MAG: SGNH/GDSL hydrolase family protein [Candidatus Omnitrophica bacterium]|nr:SGNH/GDSL hydrolase family protein [Candidatus Omnitrophota bacterium]MDD5553396.1 SGNH/GDSL hydrolase family protein [Candidatus Omnitrophota bacterium]